MFESFLLVRLDHSHQDGSLQLLNHLEPIGRQRRRPSQRITWTKKISLNYGRAGSMLATMIKLQVLRRGKIKMFPSE